MQLYKKGKKGSSSMVDSISAVVKEGGTVVEHSGACRKHAHPLQVFVGSWKSPSLRNEYRITRERIGLKRTR